MSVTVRLYVGKDMDVTYDTERCIHAAECTRGLPAVFDNSRRPSIQPTGPARIQLPLSLPGDRVEPCISSDVMAAIPKPGPTTIRSQ